MVLLVIRTALLKGAFSTPPPLPPWAVLPEMALFIIMTAGEVRRYMLSFV